MIRNDPPAGVPDAAAILRSVGEAAYEWRLDTDVLSWSPQAGDLFGVPAADFASGRAFAAHVQAEPGESRADVVQASTQSDAGAAVAVRRALYRVSAALARLGLDMRGESAAAGDFGRRDAEQLGRLRRPGQSIAVEPPFVGGFSHRPENGRGVRDTGRWFVTDHDCPLLGTRDGSRVLLPAKDVTGTLRIILKQFEKTAKSGVSQVAEG